MQQSNPLGEETHLGTENGSQESKQALAQDSTAQPPAFPKEKWEEAQEAWQKKNLLSFGKLETKNPFPGKHS